MKTTIYISVCSVLLAGCTSLATLTDLPTYTVTRSVAPTSSPTQTVTATYIATPDQSKTDQQIVEDLFKENGSCELPCWWGISPGKTSWESASSFLKSFALSIQEGIFKRYGIERLEYLADFNVPTTIQETGLVGIEFGVDENGIVTEIRTEANWKVETPDYTVPGILQRFGKPSEIKIFAIVSTPIGPVYTLVLKFPGIMVVKEGDARLVENKVEICPSRLPVESQLWLWQPEKEREFEELAAGLLFREGENEYLDLTNVSDLNTESFYLLYSSESTKDCFLIAREPWY